MITETSTREELLSEVNNTATHLLDGIGAVEENKFNTIPYEGSWTAGQLVRHVSKSTAGIAKAMRKEAKQAGRDAGERILQLKKIFLDFTSKLNAPEFIVPEEKLYDKQASIAELQLAFEQFEINASSASLNEQVEGFPLGPVTKLELLHFVIYHTRRHIHQLEKISKAL